VAHRLLVVSDCLRPTKNTRETEAARSAPAVRKAARRMLVGCSSCKARYR
jgi:hypothetical protein